MSLQAATRVVQAIELVTRNSGAKLDEIADELGVHKSNALRLMATLRELNWVSVNEDNGKYGLGPRLVGIGVTAAQELKLERALAIASMIRDLTGETAHVAIRQDDHMLIVGRVDSSQPLRVSCDLGTEDHLHTSASGKAHLASLSDDELDELLANMSFDRLTPNSLTSLEQLRTEIDRIRRVGYAIDNEEGRLGVRCLGVSIRLGGHPESVAISATGPADRWTLQSMEEVAPRILESLAPYSRPTTDNDGTGS